MYKILKIWLFIMLIGAVTGCGTQLPATDPQEIVEDVQPSDNQTPAEEQETPPPASDPAEQETAEGTPEREVKYAMDQNYRFKPVSEDIPSKAVLLTFDDGPKEEALLQQILDTLHKHEAKAIFFVNGYRVKAKPELLTIIDEHGQTIGNHSWDHVDLKKLSEQEVISQLADVQQIVQEITGKKPRFFRPPFGSGNETVKQIAKDHGMLYMTWSNGSLDWDKSTKDQPDKVIQNVLEQLHPGANILMHELQWTADALDTLLSKLKELDYTFIDPQQIDLYSLEQEPQA